MSGLHEKFDEIVADLPVYGDLDRAIEQANRERRHRYGMVAGLAAAAAVVAVIVGVLAVTRDGNNSQPPIGPVTTPTRTPTTETWEPPEPLRPAASRVVQHDEDAFGYSLDWDDPRDAVIAEIDIVSVVAAIDMRGGSSWRFRLAARPPFDPADRVIAYGIVVDGDGDRRADCQIGINNDARENGFHVWVTNLRTQETAVQDGGPYGVPVEFAHPAEKGRQDPPEMSFGFLRGLKHPAPCESFGDSSTYYAWSSVTEAGQVTGRDYAPDAAWLPITWQ